MRVYGLSLVNVCSPLFVVFVALVYVFNKKRITRKTSRILLDVV
jgi:hypothetical protein